jgi:hypothetical protein
MDISFVHLQCGISALPVVTMTYRVGLLSRGAVIADASSIGAALIRAASKVKVRSRFGGAARHGLRQQSCCPQAWGAHGSQFAPTELLPASVGCTWVASPS